MLPQALPVVAHHDDEHPIHEAQTPERVQHAAQHRIGKRNLTVVGDVGKGLAQGRRRRVGLVGIVEMEPDEEGRGRGDGIGLEPADGGRARLVAGSL